MRDYFLLANEQRSGIVNDIFIANKQNQLLFLSLIIYKDKLNGLIDNLNNYYTKFKFQIAQDVLVDIAFEDISYRFGKNYKPPVNFPKDTVRLFLYKYDLLEKEDLYYRILFLKGCAESQASALGRLAKVFLAEFPRLKHVETFIHQALKKH